MGRSGGLCEPIKTEKGAPRLFIFVRSQRKEGSRSEELARGLTLRNIDGSFITGFDDNVTVRNNAEGWLAFSAPIPPECYLLNHDFERHHVMPIHVFERWDSQIFLPFDGTIQLDRASFYFARKGRGFNPEASWTMRWMRRSPACAAD